MLEEKPEEVLTGAQTFVVSTDQSATVSTDGVSIKVPRGAVPTNANNEAGRVAFSAEHTDSYPGTLPYGYTYVNGSSFKAEPMNFIFTTPLTITLNTLGMDPADVVVLKYNENTGEWDIMPIISSTDTTVTISTVELGYFVIAKRPASARFGGIRIPKDSFANGYYYYLTIDNGSQSKRISVSSNNSDLYMADLPLGTYTVTVSRQRRNTLDQTNAGDEYLMPFSVNVNTVLANRGSGMASCTGWTVVRLPNSNWIDGRPTAWGTVTPTYGTGTFQATLTWTNTSTSATDYDLHLSGPNNMHVYFAHKQDGGFELDRDWLRQEGNAVENIYSIRDNLAAGEYTVFVHHYSGSTGKTFNVRVILDGIVVKSTSGIVDSGNMEIYKFNIR